MFQQVSSALSPMHQQSINDIENEALLNAAEDYLRIHLKNPNLFDDALGVIIGCMDKDDFKNDPIAFTKSFRQLRHHLESSYRFSMEKRRDEMVTSYLSSLNSRKTSNDELFKKLQINHETISYSSEENLDELACRFFEDYFSRNCGNGQRSSYCWFL